MKTFTVIGFYPEADYSRFATWIEAVHADAAEDAAIMKFQDLAVVGVLLGKHDLEDTHWAVNFG